MPTLQGFPANIVNINTVLEAILNQYKSYPVAFQTILDSLNQEMRNFIGKCDDSNRTGILLKCKMLTTTIKVQANQLENLLNATLQDMTDQSNLANSYSAEQLTETPAVWTNTAKVAYMDDWQKLLFAVNKRHQEWVHFQKTFQSSLSGIDLPFADKQWPIGKEHLLQDSELAEPVLLTTLNNNYETLYKKAVAMLNAYNDLIKAHLPIWTKVTRQKISEKGFDLMNYYSDLSAQYKEKYHKNLLPTFNKISRHVDQYDPNLNELLHEGSQVLERFIVEINQYTQKLETFLQTDEMKLLKQKYEKSQQAQAATSFSNKVKERSAPRAKSKKKKKKKKRSKATSYKQHNTDAIIKNIFNLYKARHQQFQETIAILESWIESQKKATSEFQKNSDVEKDLLKRYKKLKIFLSERKKKLATILSLQESYSAKYEDLMSIKSAIPHENLLETIDESVKIFIEKYADLYNKVKLHDGMYFMFQRAIQEFLFDTDLDEMIDISWPLPVDEERIQIISVTQKNRLNVMIGDIQSKIKSLQNTLSILNKKAEGIKGVATLKSKYQLYHRKYVNNKNHFKEQLLVRWVELLERALGLDMNVFQVMNEHKKMLVNCLQRVVRANDALSSIISSHKMSLDHALCKTLIGLRKPRKPIVDSLDEKELQAQQREPSKLISTKSKKKKRKKRKKRNRNPSQSNIKEALNPNADTTAVAKSTKNDSVLPRYPIALLPIIQLDTTTLPQPRCDDTKKTMVVADVLQVDSLNILPGEAPSITPIDLESQLASLPPAPKPLAEVVAVEPIKAPFLNQEIINWLYNPQDDKQKALSLIIVEHCRMAAEAHAIISKPENYYNPNLTRPAAWRGGYAMLVCCATVVMLSILKDPDQKKMPSLRSNALKRAEKLQIRLFERIPQIHNELAGKIRRLQISSLREKHNADLKVKHTIRDLVTVNKMS